MFPLEKNREKFIEAIFLQLKTKSGGSKSFIVKLSILIQNQKSLNFFLANLLLRYPHLYGQSLMWIRITIKIIHFCGQVLII